MIKFVANVDSVAGSAGSNGAALYGLPVVYILEELYFLSLSLSLSLTHTLALCVFVAPTCFLSVSVCKLFSLENFYYFRYSTPNANNKQTAAVAAAAANDKKA